jgi:hypothetical protein
MVFKSTVVNLEVKRPAGKWQKVSGESYAKIKADPDTGLPRGLGFDTISGFTQLMEDNKNRSVFATMARSPKARFAFWDFENPQDEISQVVHSPQAGWNLWRTGGSNGMEKGMACAQNTRTGRQLSTAHSDVRHFSRASTPPVESHFRA